MDRDNNTQDAMQQYSANYTTAMVPNETTTTKARNDQGTDDVQLFDHQQEQSSSTTSAPQQEKLNDEKKSNFNCFRRKMKRRCSKVGRMFFASSLESMGAETAAIPTECETHSSPSLFKQASPPTAKKNNSPSSRQNKIRKVSSSQNFEQQGSMSTEELLIFFSDV